jgi:hypothetical protein
MSSPVEARKARRLNLGFAAFGAVGILAAIGLVARRLAPTRWGWAPAVGLAVLATPRLSPHQLMALLTGLREPGSARWSVPGWFSVSRAGRTARISDGSRGIAASQP